MVGAVGVEVPQGGVFAVVTTIADEIEATGAAIYGIINFPTEFIESSQAGVFMVTTMATPVDVSQTAVFAIIKGRTYNPKLRAWTYTMDGHDFYVLRLAEGKTLVFDLSTEQWSWFTSGTLDFWRVSTGMNWYSAGSIPSTHGSNIICLDDTFGHVWVLNPEQGYDDYAANPPGDAQRFPRVATGQVIARQRIHLPVYSVYLTASAGQPVLTGDEVELEYSDDLGNTYVSAGAIAVNAGDYTQQFPWQSLGLITQIGRLFRIVDDGAFARIDGLDCHIGGARG